jgi:TPR repeat protein
VPLPRPAAIADAGPREASAAPAAATPGSARQGDALVRDARRLLARGRLAEGRDKLKQAVAAGNGHAANVLAKTYDPAVLKSWHVKGAQVDPAEARRWYEKAKELGSPAAKVALDHMN